MEYPTRGHGFEWVYLIVSPQNPFKDPSLALQGEQRYLAAVEAVKRHPGLRVWVDDIELHRDPPQYTIDTLDELKACQAARHGKKPAEYRGDLLMQTAERNLENLKEHGDWVVFPQAVDDFARNKFALAPDGALLYEGVPVKTVEYSESAAPRPIPL